jgi:hypothetical protein
MMDFPTERRRTYPDATYDHTDGEGFLADSHLGCPSSGRPRDLTIREAEGVTADTFTRFTAVHHGVTRRALLERLIVAADDSITANLDPRWREWDAYFRVHAEHLRSGGSDQTRTRAD